MIAVHTHGTRPTETQRAECAYVRQSVRGTHRVQLCDVSGVCGQRGTVCPSLVRPSLELHYATLLHRALVSSVRHLAIFIRVP